ncbi:DUF5329 family protein [Vibrio parahaemolyticus]|uniref:DUF5329 family protein n=1 Tax=Vibrio mediterranei TaxID=689 RepID=UPI00406886C0
MKLIHSLLISGLFISANALADTEEDVLYLINQMRQSDCDFIRNGDSHNGTEAAEHLTRKWNYAKDDVTSTQMFVDDVASKSWFTGTPYQVNCQGKLTTSADWLTQQLKQR